MSGTVKVTREMHEYILKERAKPTAERPSLRAIARALNLDPEAVRKWSFRSLDRPAGVAEPGEPPAEPKPESVPEQIQHLRAKLGERSAEMKRLIRMIGEQREIRDGIKEAVVACEPYSRVPYKVPEKHGKPVVAVLKCSDWQLGEVINPRETEGFGEFNHAIAERRMFSIVDSFIDWVNAMRHAYRIDEVRIFREGDLVSGNIHKELEITNEFPAPVATAKAGFMLAEVAARVAAHFKTVIVEGVDADNHGRMNPKPQAKQKAQNNWCYLAAVVAEEALKKHKNVEFRWTEGMKYLTNVAGFNFLIQHGDGIKSSLSIPYYGLERDRARESTKRMNTDKTFHYVSCGHYHVPALISGNILINVSLPGTTEFDHSCGRHAPPSQVAFLVHPTHGMFNLIPFTVK